MSGRWAVRLLVPVFMGALSFPMSAQGKPDPKAPAANVEEIPFEHCDRLPVVRVRIDTVEMRFLVDSGATTMLNLRSFPEGKRSAITVSSWAGNAATSAREVSIPVLALGNHQIRDLSPIGNACGGKIDGLFGVDLMEKMGLKLDFERELASFKPQSADIRRTYDDMEAAMHPCVVAFQEGKAKEFEDCLDPEIVLYTPHGEFTGRKQVLEYMQERYFRFAPHLTYDMSVHEVKMFGDALWYSYDYILDSPEEHHAGHGMSMCRKTQGRWRLLNMHQSLRESDLQAEH
jgi:uncharacterized protein DUF4440/aspartyl protease